MPEPFLALLFAGLIGAPAASALIQTARLAFLPERREAVTVSLAVGALVAAGLSAFGLAAAALTGPRALETGTWFHDQHYAFALHFVADGVSATYAIISLSLLLLIASFSRRYVHKEPGFHRFYLFLTLFGIGLLTVSVAGTLELLIIGWEIVGLMSVLLIAFFTTRPKPAKNALRAFTTYRLCDVGLIAAAILAHHAGGGETFRLLNAHPWFGLRLDQESLAVGLLILLAAMGKAALFPFSGWLPRAMEGPTPSSAVFYGALSVHLGPLLLMRAGDVIAAQPVVAAAVIAVGVLTAVTGRMIGRVQTDIKSRLAYGSITQLGVIVAEVGLGLHALALFHIAAHASVRTLQILRAPSLLHDHQHLERMLGHPARAAPRGPAASAFERWSYRFGIERGGLDTLLRDRIVFGVLGAVGRLDAIDRRVARRLASGAASPLNVNTQERSAS